MRLVSAAVVALLLPLLAVMTLVCF